MRGLACPGIKNMTTHCNDARAGNHLDVAPLIAGHVFSLENVIGTVPGIVSPILTGYIVRDETQDEWSLVFYITAAIYVVGTVVFCVFGRGDRVL